MAKIFFNSRSNSEIAISNFIILAFINDLTNAKHYTGAILVWIDLGSFKNAYELLILRALKFLPVNKKTHLSVYGYDILCGISKDTNLKDNKQLYWNAGKG